MNNHKVAVIITGQLRNASENIENWINTAFSNCEPTFYFCIWDKLGNVDLNKMYSRSLRVKKESDVKFVEVSSCDLYLKEKTDLATEINKIKRLIPNSKFKIQTYSDEYLYKIGQLEVNQAIIDDTSPFWQGSIPVAYINKLAMNWVTSEDIEYDAYCRIQGETTFSPNTNIDWASLNSNKNLIITSQNTINKNHQLSIKFFSSSLKNFSNLMNAYDYLIEEYRNYSKGTPWEKQPIGERFLKKIALRDKCKIDYSVKTIIKRPRCYPVNPVKKRISIVKKSWTQPILIDVERHIIEKIKEQERIFKNF